MKRATIFAPNGRPAREVVAAYEAPIPSRQRSTIPHPLTDGVDSVDQYTRAEISRLAWHLWENSPFFRGAVERLVTYTVGAGIMPASASSDPEWNAAEDAAFAARAESIEATSGLSWGAYVDTLARAAFVAGDCLSVPVLTASGTRLRLVESHQIATVKATANADRARDGVRMDAAGSVVAYTLADGKTEVPASEGVLHFFPGRAGLLRGVSLFASAISRARDIEDILSLEKQAVKEGSAITSVVKTASGELDDEDAIAASETMPDGESAVRYYQARFGAEAKVLRMGDDFEQFRNDRPGPVWQGFMAFLAETVVASTGMPASVVLGLKVGGADTRKELATALRVIERWQARLAEQLTRIRNFFVEIDIADGLVPPPPKDWRRVEWLTPREVTADAGREAAQDREDVKFGMHTLRDHFGRFQQDWRKQLRQRATEVAEVNRLAAEFGLEPDEIAQRFPNPPPAESPAGASGNPTGKAETK